MSRHVSNDATHGLEPWRAWEREYRAKGRLWRGVRLDPLTRGLLEAEPALRAARWLEAGCGDGKGLVPLARGLTTSAPLVVGFDTSHAAIALARAAVHEAFGADSRRVALVRADVCAPPFAAHGFDALRAVHVLGHLRSMDRPEAAAGLVRLLSAGGWFVLQEFGTGDFRAGSGVEVEPGMRRRGTGIETQYFTREEIAALVESAGLDVVSLTKEAYVVDYAGRSLPRERWDVLGRAA